MPQIYFTSDLYFGHSNILKHSPKRPYSDKVDIAAHDEWLLDLWRSTVDKRDTIYILGDLTFLKSKAARHLLEKLPGHKFLIEGNHDGSIRADKHYFREYSSFSHCIATNCFCSSNTCSSSEAAGRRWATWSV